jgi:hypothetical protein
MILLIHEREVHKMLEMIGNIGVGELFIHEESIFVVMPFNWEEERYLNLCLLTVETDFDEYYEKGEFYWFDEETEVEKISQEKLKKLLDK